MNKKQKMQQGYVALITILLVSAVALVLVVDTTLFGVSETKTSLLQEQSTQAYYLAESCAEYALLNLQNDLEYSGEETLNIGDYSCEILAVEGQGNQDRVIKTQGLVNNQTRKLRIDIESIAPGMEITSWEEVTEL